MAPDPIDLRVRELVQHGEVACATSTLLDAHGADIFGFLVGVLENPRRARLAYTSVVKHVAAELVTFQWNCSSRVWLYSIARRELVDRRAHAEPDETKPVADAEIRRLLTVIEAVRRALTEEERELLILRVDRGFDWRSLAITQLGETAADTAIAREAGVLRARIGALVERVKRLIELQLRPQ